MFHAAQAHITHGCPGGGLGTIVNIVLGYFDPILELRNGEVMRMSHPGNHDLVLAEAHSHSSDMQSSPDARI